MFKLQFHDTGVNPADVEQGSRGRFSGPTLQDLIVILLPYMAPLIAVLIGACILYDPTMDMLL